jgi:hypothetical protein
VVVGLEGRRTVTRYATANLANDHLNLGIGFEY